jgi:hypothetical protein
MPRKLREEVEAAVHETKTRSGWPPPRRVGLSRGCWGCAALAPVRRRTARHRRVRTPGPADQKFLYGHIGVTLSLIARHPLWQTIGLPLLGLLYVRAQDIAKIPRKHGWKFRTKLQRAAAAMLRFADVAKAAKKAVWAVADGAYAKRAFLQPLRAASVIVVSRLRKDAALWTVPETPKTRQRGRPRQYGKQRIGLARRAAHPGGWRKVECVVYGQRTVKTIKSFVATYRPADGPIRVVIVKEHHGCEFFFGTDPTATPREIIEAFADRPAMEQNFHDVKDVCGAGQRQVRNIRANVAAFNLNLWLHTLVECWAWGKPAEEIRDRRDSPWDDPQRRPSHADRRQALRRQTLRNEFSSLAPAHRRSSKIRSLYQRLIQLAT